MRRAADSGEAVLTALDPALEETESGRLLRRFSLGLFLVLASVSLLMTGPLIHWDEGSYLLNAAAIAGKLHGNPANDYYSGYSLLLVPAFLLSGKFGTIYHYALIINAALLASLPFALWRIARTLTPQANPRWQVIAAIAASCQAAILANSQLALAENLLVPLYAWFIASGCIALSTRKLTHVLACGALAGALFVVHPRGLVMAVPVLTAFSLPVLRDRRSWMSLLVLWIGAAMVAGMHFPLEWLAEKSSNAPATAYGLGSVVSKALRRDSIGQIIFNAFGAFSYLVIATFGLLILAVREAVPPAWSALRPGVQGTPRDHVCLALLLALLTSIIVTAVYFVPPTRADQIVYGRYTLPTLLPLLVLGIGALPAPGQWLKVAAPALGAGLICVAVMALAFHFLPHPAPQTWVHINVIDLYVPFMLVRRIDWLVIGGYFCAIAITLYAISYVSKQGAAFFFAMVGIAVAAAVTLTMTLPSNVGRATARQSEAAVRTFEAATGTPLCVSIAADVDAWHSMDYRNWLFDRIDQSTQVDRQRCVPARIASLLAGRPDPREFRLVSTDIGIPYGLFVAHSPALEQFAASHKLPPANALEPIPADDRNADIEMDPSTQKLTAGVGVPLDLRVRVTNRGSRVLSSDPSGWLPHPVLVGAHVDEGGKQRWNYRSALPQSLAPGQSVDVTVRIGPIDRPGLYPIHIGVLQEHIAWFAGGIDTTLEVGNTSH